MSIFDLLIGVVMTQYPGVFQEWLYPEMSLSGGLIGIIQLGLLRCGRGLIGLYAPKEVICYLWSAHLPLALWSLSSLSHLGAKVGGWHGAHLIFTLFALSALFTLSSDGANRSMDSETQQSAQ